MALRYSRPPIWRSVQVPLMFTLGDLHSIIQVLFGWDGDHLHDFTVAGGTRYSDVFFHLEEVEDEEDARLRGAFAPGTRKPVLYEYGEDESPGKEPFTLAAVSAAFAGRSARPA